MKQWRAADRLYLAKLKSDQSDVSRRRRDRQDESCRHRSVRPATPPAASAPARRTASAITEATIARIERLTLAGRATAETRQEAAVTTTTL